MSEHYKIIRRTREAIKELKAKAWAPTKIAKHIGVSLAVVQDILVIDEVAMNLRTPTIEKFVKFLASHEKKKPVQIIPEPKPERKREPDPNQDEQIPQPAFKKFVISDDLLAMTDSLIVEYNERGYRMDVTISRIFKPDSDEAK